MDSLYTLVCCLLPIFSWCTEGAVGEPIQYTNCGPDNLIGVELSPCSKQPCVFSKGINVTVTIDFKTATVVSGMSTRVYGIVAGIPVPYPLPKSDGCNDCNLSCPLAPGSYKYINVFPVLQSYPEIRLPVKWELVDQDNNPIVCFVFPMQITN